MIGNIGAAGLVWLCLLLFCPAVYCNWKNPETMDPTLRLIINDTFEWHQLEPKALTLSFDMEKLTDTLVLNLYGYTERNVSKISKLKMPFTKLATKTLPDMIEGEVDLLQLDLSCITSKPECNKFDMGYVEIVGKRVDNVTFTVNMLSQIVPLGWFLKKNFDSESFKDWAYGKCKQWFESEKDEIIKKAIGDVSCPSSLDAAQSDPGWFLKSHYLAGFPSSQRIGGNSSAEPEQQCFYSAVQDINETVHAAPASICCYRLSDSQLLYKEFMADGNLRLHGSSALRSHPFGSDKHDEHYLSGRVPYLSHWYWDKMPFLYCCHWWKGSTCLDMYLKLRPAPKIRPKPTGSKATYAYASHVHPIGGGAPAFCSDVGEYWLVRSPAIEVQIRSYVVSTFVGTMPPTYHHNSVFYPAASKSAFFTGLAMRSMQAPNRVVELVSPDGEFRSYVQGTDLESENTVIYDGSMGRGFGTKILVGEAVFDHNNKIYSFLVKNGMSRVGMYAYVPRPGEEMFNLYLSITADLIGGNFTGLAAGGSCQENRVTETQDRLFTSLCDNCDDFRKYSESRPLFFEPMKEANLKGIKEVKNTDCKGDVTCKYMVWSTSYQPYYDASSYALTKHIKPLLPKISVKGLDVCAKPDLYGLYVGPKQDFLEGQSIFLKCMKPHEASGMPDKAVQCRKKDGELGYDVPQDFACAETAESEEVKVAEEKAQAADAAYTKKNYDPPKEEKIKLASSMRPGHLASLLLNSLAIGFVLHGLAAILQ